MPVYWQYHLQNSSKMQEHVCFLDINTLLSTQAIGATLLEFTKFSCGLCDCVTCLQSSIKLRSCLLCILILHFWCLPFSLDSHFLFNRFYFHCLGSSLGMGHEAASSEGTSSCLSLEPVCRRPCLQVL